MQTKNLLLAIGMASVIGFTPAAALEIFSWWTTGGEAAALKALFDTYGAEYPNAKLINAAVAGGAGTNAKAVLKTRVLGGNPPDSFQVHMGAELFDTWVSGGFMEPVDSIYEVTELEAALPEQLLDYLRSDEGNYYAVPLNVHRANVLWYNQKVLADAGLEPPESWEEFLSAAETLKAQGITPLALGDNGIWATTQILETILLAQLGPERYRGLWDGSTVWDSPEVTRALEILSQVLDNANADHAARSWDQANDLVIQGTAAMTIMGDWAVADYEAKNFTDYGYAPVPGTAGIYDGSSDTFGLPKKAPDREEALAWLELVASKEGQEVFNTVKGSICARTDCDPEKFGEYQRWAMQSWSQDELVPSLAHGAAASEAWMSQIDNAINLFVARKDISATQAMLVRAAQEALN